MRRLVEREQDVPLEEIKRRLGLGCTTDAIHWVLSRQGADILKRRSKRLGKTGPTSPGPDAAGNAAKARSPRPGLSSSTSPAAKTNMTRLGRRSPRGERLVCHAPHGHWRPTTMISSVRLDGTTA